MSNTEDFIPWWEPALGKPVSDAVNRVLESDYINEGEVTQALGARLAEIAGVKHGFAMTSCTVSIATALMAIGVGHGDEVIVPDVTYIATANAVKLAGAEVRLVDVEPENFTISVEDVAEAINERSRAVVAVDLNGRAANYDKLEALCADKGIALVCDSAQGLGSRCQGRGLGSFGAVGCFSFSGNKMFFAGQGGGIVTNDDDLALRIREIRDHGRREPGTGGDDIHYAVGYNFRYTNLQSAVVMAQLEQLEDRRLRARKRDSWYRELLAECEGIRFPETDEEALTLWGDVLVDNREKVCAALDRHNIGYRRTWHPIHRQIPYATSDDAFPNALTFEDHGLWLPSALSLTREQAVRVADSVREGCAA